MTGLNTYSTTPANNVNANTGINWDEGMAPAAVNNSARQNMTDLRLAFNDLIWFQYGKGDLAGAPTYSSGTVFTQASSASLSAIYHVGRRVKAVGSSTGTIYGSISVTAFAASTQTVTIAWDSGSLSNEALTIYLSQIPVTGTPVPSRGIANQRTAFFSSTAASPTLTASSSLVQMGLGATWALTPIKTGKVKILATGYCFCATSGGAAAINASYGTGTAPSNAAAATGTTVQTDNILAQAASSNQTIPFSLYTEVTGLTLNTAYWFDMLLKSGGSGGNVSIVITSVLIEEF